MLSTRSNLEQFVGNHVNSTDWRWFEAVSIISNARSVAPAALTSSQLERWASGERLSLVAVAGDAAWQAATSTSGPLSEWHDDGRATDGGTIDGITMNCIADGTRWWRVAMKSLMEPHGVSWSTVWPSTWPSDNIQPGRVSIKRVAQAVRLSNGAWTYSMWLH